MCVGTTTLLAAHDLKLVIDQLHIADMDHSSYSTANRARLAGVIASSHGIGHVTEKRGNLATRMQTCAVK